MKSLLVTAITASLLVAVVVTVASLLQTPTYETSARMLVGQEEELSDGTGLIPLAAPPETIQKLTQTMILYIDSRPVAEEAIRRLDLRMSPDELLTNLTVEQVESSQVIRLTYTDTDPERAARVVNTVGRVSSERISAMSVGETDITATLYDKATVPDAPASPKPLRNGLIALVVALALSAALIEARRRRVFGG